MSEAACLRGNSLHDFLQCEDLWEPIKRVSTTINYSIPLNSFLQELPTLEQQPPNINEKIIVHGTTAGSAPRITSAADPSVSANTLPLLYGSMPLPPLVEEAAPSSSWRSVMRSWMVDSVAAGDLGMLRR